MTIDESLSRCSETDSAFESVTSKDSNMHDEISAEDMEKIEILRKLVKNDLSTYYDTDFNLLRWIQGHRELSLNQVAKKLRAHLKMRKSTWDLDNLARKPRKHTIHGHWMYGITGESQVLPNVIVNIEQCGATDYSGMLETFSHAEVLKARSQDLEDMLAEVMELEQRTGKQASILFVMDMQGLKYDKRCFHLARGALRALTEFMAEHYVELCKYFILVNVPSFIYAIWTISKPILPERTRQKVKILSASNWRDEILSYATGKVLPESWQHGDTIEMQRFEAKLKPPPPYPIENFFRNNSQNATDGATTHKIAAGKSLILNKELFPGDVLKWWILADSDFGFAVFRSTEKNPSEENFDDLEVAYPRFDWMPGPSEAPLTDQIVEKGNGANYHIWISNRPAWWSSLTIQAKINVECAQPAA